MYLYKLLIELEGIKPRIWRTVVVPSDISMSDFHKIIQTTMGWTNSHLHAFRKGGDTFEPPVDENDLWGESFGTDYTGIKLNMLLNKEKDIMHYEYDFGDGWQHRIRLEEILEGKGDEKPVCLDGAMACPPEDIGGAWGFNEFKKALKDPLHPQHADYVQWHEGEFDAENFDINVVNKLLAEDNFGTLEWD